METLKTIYTVKGRKVKVLWEFHYDIEGYLVEFKILEGRLNDIQLKWLIDPLKFPYRESMISMWKGVKEFSIIVGKPKLSFELFWKAYNYKIKKVVTQRAWQRLSQSDKINAIAGVKNYDGFLHRKVSQAKANPATYLNQRYWEDSYGSV